MSLFQEIVSKHFSVINSTILINFLVIKSRIIFYKSVFYTVCRKLNNYFISFKIKLKLLQVITSSRK